MSKSYDVGYKRPPTHSRFKKGRSGNSQGRPKGTKNLKTDLAEELQERVVVREGASEKPISKQRAMVKSMMARAIKGDMRAATIIYTMTLRLLEVDDSDNTEAPLTDDEHAILATLEEQILHKARQRAASRPETSVPQEMEDGHDA